MIVVSLSAASVLIAKSKTKTTALSMGEAVHPAKSEIWSTDQLLPELADNEVNKCLQYLRMNKDTFQELLALVEPPIARRITKFRFCAVIS